MKYQDILLQHFFNPKNVGFFAKGEEDIGYGAVGSYDNGSLVHFYIKVHQGIIKAARFKAYGNVPIIATCSFVTEWVTDKTIEQASQLKCELLMDELNIPEIKIHCALLVEDALKTAINHFLSKV